MGGKRTTEQLLEAYVDANHELVNVLAAVKQVAENALSGIEPMDPQYVYDILTGKLERARAAVR